MLVVRVVPTKKLMPSIQPVKELPSLSPVEITIEDGKLNLGLSREWVPPLWQDEDLETLGKITVERGASANWSGMGCYKTSTALWLPEVLHELTGTQLERILVITTKTGKVPYMQAAPKAVPSFEIADIEIGAEIPEHFPGTTTLYFAHYDVFVRQFDKSKLPEHLRGKKLKRKVKEKYMFPNPTAQALLDMPWDLVIVSEAHRIKNRATSWVRTIKHLKTRYKHIETGTGFVNRPDEVWSLLNFLDKNTYSGYWKFRRRYCQEIIGEEGYTQLAGIRPGREKQFQKEIHKWGVRREFHEVFDASELLPPHKVRIELSPTQRRMYNEIKSDLETLDQAGEALFSPTVLSRLTRLRQICVATPKVTDQYYDEDQARYIQEVELEEPSAKLNALIDILEDTDTPSVVYSNFVTPLELAKKRLDKKGIKSIVLRSEDSTNTRLDKINLFQTGEIPVFLTTLGLGSESITLTAADKVIFLDRSWSPATNNQAVARVWRPSQTRAVLPIHIEARKTVDQVVEAKLNQKQKWFDQVFGKESK